MTPKHNSLGWVLGTDALGRKLELFIKGEHIRVCFNLFKEKVTRIGTHIINK